jgi:hypothetical protein
MNKQFFPAVFVAAFAATSQADDSLLFLDGYNYVITWDKGRIADIKVSGENGSGKDAPLLMYDAAAQKPTQYQSLNPHAAIAVSLLAQRLLAMREGEKIALNLPRQTVALVHDNRFIHANGDVTWVGYVEGQKELRAFITMAETGEILGQFETPAGLYLLENAEGRTWLVDVKASGLRPGSLKQDALVPANGPANSPTASGAVAQGTTTVDLLALYTLNLATPVTRINTLVAMANQAYVDSKINLKLRLVGAVRVNYTENNNNSTALNDLTYGRSTLNNVASLRTKYGADLASLIRPFIKPSQVSCGTAWVNGANGGVMNARYGFSVVSDGRDKNGSSYYCGNYSLTHELGHNFGSAHDRAHSSVAGAFPYSYGYKLPVSGKGTIMSYYNPRIGYFSNPRITCFGELCGKVASEDNARSIGSTSPKVANFMPRLVP